MATGKLLAAIGVTLVVIGLIFSYAPWLINWFGKLPGDIRIEDEKKNGCLSRSLPCLSSVLF